MAFSIPTKPWAQSQQAESKHSLKDSLQTLLSQADIHFNGNQPWDLQIHNKKFYQRVLSQGSLGLGESYMDGWWDCERLDLFFYKILQANLTEKIKANFKLTLQILYSKILNYQSKHRAFEVGEKHYDLGNDLYHAMLDTRLIYSCGYWKNAQTLDQAQVSKLKLICQKLKLQPGMTLLDIGCGWGGLARFAAENCGVSVTGITVSKQQAELAKQVCQDLPVEIKFQDYRALNKKFDRIVSVGMFEHVGYKNYKVFMQTVNDCLNDEGLFLLHTIGGNETTTFTDPWIHKYIFPNSMLPSVKQISQAAEPLFIMEDWHNFGTDYYKTLMAWHENFTQHWQNLKQQYNQRFYRMWVYYLLSCAGMFRARRNQLWQIVFSKRGMMTHGYHSIR